MKVVANVTKFDNSNGIKGFATINLEDSFVIENLTVRENKNGELFVSFPSRKLDKPDSNGRMYRDIAYPVTKEFRKEISEIVLAEYSKL